MTWFHETLHGAAQQSLEIGHLLYRGQTEFQSIEVFENAALGRVLVLDGILQTTERDEYVYHEMLTHVPILAHGEVSDILIIGGGDGGALEETLKHPVASVTMVEIDAEVIAICREHMPAISGRAFDDDRTQLIVADGTAFVAETERRFDVIIVDSTDPVGPGDVLFQRPFYENCRRCLRERGLLITQNGVPFFQADEVVSSGRAFSELFAHHGFYVAPVPSYYGGFMAFGWASPGLDLVRVERAEVARRYAALGIETRYYNPDIHGGALALPNDIRALLA